MLHHGTSLVLKGQGILLRGPSGAGKSDLALRLIHKGALLVADDQTEIKSLVMTPPQALQGQLEIRGIGIVRMPFQQQHPLTLVIDLKPWRDIDRFPEETVKKFDDTLIPHYEIDPFEAAAVEKILVLCAKT